ncbi:MAG: hypothetical protein PQJ58_03125 [Spirochaetales bacterium]|nr:hypothetical protein [Spirochaetales bacterium]
MSEKMSLEYYQEKIRSNNQLIQQYKERLKSNPGDKEAAVTIMSLEVANEQFRKDMSTFHDI